jgi:hypothetical protein
MQVPHSPCSSNLEVVSQLGTLPFNSFAKDHHRNQ